MALLRSVRGTCARTVVIAVTAGVMAVAALGCSSDGTSAGRPGAADRSERHERHERHELVAAIDSWLYLIDVNLDGDTVDEIVESEHDLVVIDLITSETENTSYPLAEVVDRFHDAEHPKVVLAYLDVGQAEDYRTYWEEGWGIGEPDWIVAADPDGWEGNYPVAYWDPDWWALWLDDGGLMDQVAEAGFDGVYLDWLEAYSDTDVAERAEEDGVDPTGEMVRWVGALAAHGRSRDPGFLVVGQNAAELVGRSDRYRRTIDAVAQEQVWFDGGADNDPPGDCPLPRTEDDIDDAAYVDTLEGGCLELWEDYPESTLHVSSQGYLEDLEAVAAAGLVVFTVDYATEADHVRFVLDESRDRGFVPFVGVRSLDRFEPPR